MSEEENSDFGYSDNEVIRRRKSRKIHEDEDEEDEEDDYSRRNYNSDEAEEEDDNIDDEDDEGDDIEETEEDKKFIVDDDGEEEEEVEEEVEVSSHKKKKRRKHHSFKDSDSESDLEDDMMLIAENTGIEWQKPEEKRLKRLKRRRQETSVPSRDREEEDLTKIFMNDEDAEEGEIKQRDDDHEMYDEEDDLGNFIDYEDEELTPELKEQRANERKEQKQFVKDIGESLGITDDSLFMIQQIFGDGSEYAYAMDINDMQDEDDVNDINRDNPVRLKDVYEPDEIAEKLLTEEDDAIRIKDIPERIQLRYINNPPEGDELNREAAFIEEKILMKRDQYGGGGISLQTPIRDVLKLLREENYEVPFIFSHRKDFWKDKDKLNDHELWLIYDYDEEFQAIESKKKLITSIYENLCENDSEAKNDKSITESLKQINSIERAQDLLEYIQIKYGSDAHNDTQSEEKKLKRPVRVKFYEKMKKAGVGEFVKLFHVKVRELAVSISEGIKKFFPEDEMESPEKVAEKFVVESNVYLKTPHQIINAAKSMLVQEIANEPLFKDYIRHMFEEHAVLDILPTDRGKKEIDENHIYYEFKYITGKPIKEYSEPINKVVFLQITKAEKEGLVTTSIHLENEDQRIKNLCEHIVNDNYNEFAEAWNNLRKEVLTKSLKDILFPLTSDWLKAKIINEACIIIADHCMGKLENNITKAPYDDKILEDYDSEGEYCKVVSISWGDFKMNEPGICMAVGSDGKVADHCILEGLQSRNQTAAETSPGAEALREFLMHHIPDIIIVGGWTPDLITNKMMEKIRKIADDVSKELNLIKNIPVEIGDDNPAKIYMKSARGKNEYPLYSPLMLYCVSLARTVQDSLMEYAALCNTENEISLLRLDPLQTLVPESLMNQRFERSFINAIAHVGVDINRAVQYPEYSNTLQFVSGLGKRKAANIISKITRSGGVLLSRSDLIHKNIVGANIFMNCASFLRIREKYFNQRRSDMFYDVLDDTRIHPEDYDLARKMAADALDIDEPPEDDENPSQHVEELMNGESDRLNQLLLDAYAEELENNVIHEPKRITLNQIREELKNPYKEKRRKWHPLNEDEIFVMLTGENNDTLAKGMVVSVEITYAYGKTVKGILPSGIEVSIAPENLTSQNVYNVEDHVRAGDVLNGKILRVDKERFIVDVTTVEEDLKRESDIIHDDYWNYNEERKDKKILSDAYKKATKRIARSIQHPYFKPFDYREAENYLSNRPKGEIVIRPSSKGNDHLAITWKIDDGVYQHLDIQEQEKESEFKIGKKLKVNDAEFSELDELVVVYVEPMARYAEEMMNNPKYKKGTLDDINDYLATQTKNKPNMAAYAFCIAHRKPGYFYLAYKFNANDRPKHEYVQLQPNGYVFRKVTYSNVNEIIRAFKKNPKGRIMNRSSNHQHYSHSRSMRH